MVCEMGWFQEVRDRQMTMGQEFISWQITLQMRVGRICFDALKFTLFIKWHSRLSLWIGWSADD